MSKERNLSVANSVFRSDGWKNILTGLGVKGRDKRESSVIEWEYMSEPEVESLYAASDVAGKVVDEVINESFREGYDLKADEFTPDILKKIEDERQRLEVDERFQEAWRYGRMYGGGGIIVMPKDISDLASPFVPEQISKIESLLVLTRWELPRQLIEYDIRSPNFGHPKAYRICPRSGAGQMNELVHHSRVILFPGSFLPKIKYISNNHWHDSVLNKCKRAIRDYDSAMSAVSATLDDFSVATMKIQNLSRAISEDRDDLILKRMEIANLTRSVARTIILDADKEEYAYQTRNLTGVADAVRLIAGRLVVASNMPHTKILGESPQGSNATGNSTTKDWYDHVAATQKNYVDPRLMQLWTWILSAKKGPTNGKVPVGLQAVYAPLWQEPMSVQATARLQTSQADASDITMGVLTPEEVAISRYGSGEYSTETKLEDNGKKRLAPPENT